MCAESVASVSVMTSSKHGPVWVHDVSHVWMSLIPLDGSMNVWLVPLCR